MRILGIDWGEKRIGLAISEGFFANEYMTLKVINVESAIEDIKEICQDETIGKIVLGLPVSLDRQEHSQAQKIRQLAARLGQAVKIPLELEDETLTTEEAEDILKSEGYPPEEIAEKIDQFSAKLILQQYLENHPK